MPYQPKHVFASLPQMERAVAKVIGGDPKGKNFLYTNGKSVIIRDIDNPVVADIYTEHAHNVSVAKYSPSGFYIASGDASGKIRIWDTTQKEHILKYEYTPISGNVKDIAWTEDSKRLAVVGEGREKYGSVFLWDSGSSVGEISNSSKLINSVDIRQCRPYRLVTGSDDYGSCFYEGPPFKYKNTCRDHTQFVNCVRFSPNGDHFVTASSDGQILMFDGKTGERVQSMGGEKAHSGGIYAVSWSSDSTQLISASGDKTVKLWDAATGSAVTTFTLGKEIADMQQGCLWQNNHILSISQSGYINYLDKNNPKCPIRVIKGHTKSIQCVTTHKSDGKSYIYSGSHDGHINYWDADTGENDCVSGKGHTNQVSKMVSDDATNELVTCSMDDTLRYTKLDERQYSASDVVKMDSEPKSLSVAGGKLSVVVCIGEIVLLKDKKVVHKYNTAELDFEPQVAHIHPGGTTVAVGGSDEKVHLFSIQGTVLKREDKSVAVGGIPVDLAYSKDGAFLAVVVDKKVAKVFTVADDYELKLNFYGHHARPVALAWSPDNQHFATSGMDNMVYVWDITDEDKRMKIPDTHRLHHVTGLAWVDENTLVTASHDACVKQWSITY